MTDEKLQNFQKIDQKRSLSDNTRRVVTSISGNHHVQVSTGQK